MAQLVKLFFLIGVLSVAAQVNFAPYVRPSGGASFNPTNLTQLLGYYDDTTITNTVDQSAVSNWFNAKNTDYTFMASNTTPIYLANFVNGKAVVHFSGSCLTNTIPTDLRYFTVAAVMRCTNQPFANSLFSGNLGNGGLSFDVGTTKKLRMVKEGVSVIGTNSFDTPPNWIISVMTFSNNTYGFYVNGVTNKIAAATVTLTAGRASKIGSSYVGSNPFGGYVAALAVLSTNISDSERQSLEGYWRTKYNIADHCMVVVCDGNSMTEGTGGGVIAYPSLLQSNLLSVAQVWNKGESGQTTSDMLSDITTDILPLYFSGTTNNFVVVWEGSNAIKLGSNTNDAFNGLTNYCLQATARGFKPLICTLTKRSDFDAGMEIKRVELNGLLKANWAGFAAGIVLFDEEEDLDYTVHPENFSDNIHPDT